jgi:hypothetical protein
MEARVNCGSNTKIRRVLPLALVVSGARARPGFGGAAFAGTPAPMQDSVPATAPQPARVSARDLPAVNPAQRDAAEDLNPNVANLSPSGLANAKLPQTSGAAPGPMP